MAVLQRHFTAVSVANNHTGDFGDEAFVEQLELLTAGKVPYFGGGKNLAEAHAPLMIERKGLKIALLGYNEFQPRTFEAAADSAGVAWSVDDQVVADIRAARKAGAELIVPFMHWGREYKPEATDRQRTLARLIIDAGADIVVGGHPHVTEGAEYYRGKLIVYSLGNFVFDGFEDKEALEGWVLRFSMNRSGLVDWNTVVARIDHDGMPHRDRDTASPAGRAGQDEIRMLKAE